jgi:hypothetical protein
MSKFKSIIQSTSEKVVLHKSNNPPYSIPGVDLPRIEVYDDLLDKKTHQRAWEYLIGQLWHHEWTFPANPELQIYKPSDWDDSWINSLTIRRSLSMPRCLFASDETSLQKKHPIIWELWNSINAKLNNRYEITGNPEGIKWKDYPCPETADPTLSKGWRVYANASTHCGIGVNGYIHRDTSNLSDETSVTIIWMASPVWYPSWGGELMFYPEDPDGLTGDHQQFNTPGAQQRNFQIGWQDGGRTVSLKPNRLVVYDGRTLHSTLATNHHYNTELHRRIVFRARLKV